MFSFSGAHILALFGRMEQMRSHFDGKKRKVSGASWKDIAKAVSTFGRIDDAVSDSSVSGTFMPA